MMEKSIRKKLQQLLAMMMVICFVILTWNTNIVFAEAEPITLKYIAVANSNVQISEVEKIVVGFSEEYKDVVQNAVLKYHCDETQEVFEKENSKKEGTTLEFDVSFDDANDAGTYILDSVFFNLGDVYQEVGLLGLDMDAKFGVGCEIETNPDAYAESDSDVNVDSKEEKEADEVVHDESMEETVNENTDDAIETQIMLLSDAPALVTRSSQIVVVLDPGHDAKHTGAKGNGINEEKANLKIAQYCKTLLEQYAGVTVYMTRTGEACPHPGTSSTDDNALRVEYAKSVGATVYVSIHLNSSSNSGAHGVEIYYPNSNYNSSVSQQGKGLATEIESKLVSLGLTDRGVKVRDATDNTRYPDGSLTDYYSVIKNSKLAGFPGIIIEHAFLTSAWDASNYVNSDSKLKALGEADASGIASYFGLQKDNGAQHNSSMSNTSQPVQEEQQPAILTNIIGTPQTTIDAMVRYYLDHAGQYPDFYSNTEAPDIKSFCQIYINECNAEGVRPEIAFSQAMKETAFLKYGGDVKIEQFNFAGIGATGNGNCGDSFGSVTEGIRAQVQHLKAYASYDALNGACVDTRFSYVNRGCAPYLEWLGINENPQKTGWASDQGYGQSIRDEYMNVLLGYGRSGLCNEANGDLTFYRDGNIDTQYVGLVKYNDKWYYVQNGKVDWNYTGLTKYYSTWYYVQNGILNWNYTGLTKYYSTWYYVQGGVLNWNYTGLTKYYSTWYYVQGGVLNWNYTGLTKYYSTWYYVQGGVLNWNYTGLTKYYSTWYYVQGGILNWNYTGWTKYYSTWYYVKNGVLA